MHVIIAGGTGLIGRALAADLISEGGEVIVLSRAPERARSLPAGVRVERWDARCAAGWGALAEGADAIVNLAGESLVGRWTTVRKRRIRESRVNAGHAVVEAVELAHDKPRVIVQSSGIGYYGPCGDEEITEEAPPGKDFLSQVAVAWEESTAPVKSLGVRRAISRSGIVLSMSGGAFPLMTLPFRFFAGGPLGSGRQWFPWIHIADEVRALRFLIENEAASGPFNVTAPAPLTNADFARALGQVLRRPAWIPAPAIALRFVLGEMGAILLTGQRAVPRRLLELGFTFRLPDTGTALQDLLS